MEKEPRPLRLREKLIVAAAIDYPTASEIVVSFADKWELVACFRRQIGFYENTHLYVAAFPPSEERSYSNHFLGLSPEINCSLTSYRLYKLFRPWQQPILPIAWDETRGEGRVLAGGSLRVQLQPIGQAQVWSGKKYAVFWEAFLNETGQQGDAWQADLAQFWYAVEDDLGVNKIFTQPHEPTFEKGYPRFLEHLGYALDPEFERWWSKPGGVIYGL
jgi:hypothetical protein